MGEQAEVEPPDKLRVAITAHPRAMKARIRDAIL